MVSLKKFGAGVACVAVGVTFALASTTATAGAVALGLPSEVSAVTFAPTDPVDWAVMFPDAALRAAVQAKVSDPATTLVQDLASIMYFDASSLGITSLEGMQYLTYVQNINVSNNQITSLEPLSELPTIIDINVSNNQITSLDPVLGSTHLEDLLAANNQISSLTLPNPNGAYNVDLSGNPVCPSVDFVRGGNTQSFSLDSCKLTRQWFHAMGGAYTIDGNRYTYTYSDGSGISSYEFNSLGIGQSNILLELKTVPRGVSNSSIVWTPNGEFRRDEIRTVGTDGSVLHTITMTNVSDFAIDSAFYQSLDVYLNGNTPGMLLSDGLGGVFVRDSAMSLYFQPVSGIDATYAGLYWQAQTEQDLNSLITGGYVNDAAGYSMFDEISGGNGVYYATPRVSLAPGEAYTYSFRELLFAASDPNVVRLDYVMTDPATGKDVVVDSVSQEGVEGQALDLTAPAGLPAGYELDPAAANPTQVLFGAAGPFTVVTLRVKAIVPPAAPTPTPTPTTDQPTPAPTSDQPTADQTVPSDSAASEASLPDTGANVGGIAVIAAALLAGGALILWSRRRNA